MTDVIIVLLWACVVSMVYLIGAFVRLYLITRKQIKTETPPRSLTMPPSKPLLIRGMTNTTFTDCVFEERDAAAVCLD